MPPPEAETINANPLIKGQKKMRGTGAPAPTLSGANTHRSTLAPGAPGAKASRKNDFPVTRTPVRN
jgi:hypothetical protein